MMQRTFVKTAWLAVAALLVAADGAAAGEPRARIDGEVVSIGTETLTDGSRFDEVVVRSRDGGNVRLRLGRSGTCAGCLREGDRVRVRLTQRFQGPGPHEVQTMTVRRTGETVRIRDGSGNQVRQRDRLRVGADRAQGAATRQRGAGLSSVRGAGGHRGGRR